MRDKTKLQKALNAVYNLTSFELAGAWILLKVNGIENALEYVEGIKERRLCKESINGSKVAGSR